MGVGYVPSGAWVYVLCVCGASLSCSWCARPPVFGVYAAARRTAALKPLHNRLPHAGTGPARWASTAMTVPQGTPQEHRRPPTGRWPATSA